MEISCEESMHEVRVLITLFLAERIQNMMHLCKTLSQFIWKAVYSSGFLHKV